MSLGASATEEDGRLVAKLFGSVGKIWKVDEKLIDAVTGLRYVPLCNNRKNHYEKPSSPDSFKSLIAELQFWLLFL